jgi:two-component SAPR family response regulator
MAGERTGFDEQELAAIERGMENFKQGLCKDKTSPQEFMDEMFKGAGHEALRGVARQRLAAGDYRGATVTCMKAICVQFLVQMDWLLLAEIHAEYGDTVSARLFLKKATDENGGSAFRMPEREWSGHVQRIDRIIKRKEEE